MDLKVHTEVIHNLDYVDFQNCVKDNYGIDFCFISTQECSNDSTHRFYITGILEDGDDVQLERIMSGKHVYGDAGRLLDKMVIDGFAPKGTYLIEVCW